MLFDHRKDFVAAVEHAWKTRRSAPDELRLTRLHVHVARKLAFWRSTTPRARELAASAACSVRTVRRAFAILNGLGLLSWTRLVLACRGWRAQVASRYRLLCQKPLNLQVLRSSANLAPPGSSKASKPAPVAAAFDAKAREKLVAERWLAERADRVAKRQQSMLALRVP